MRIVAEGGEEGEEGKRDSVAVWRGEGTVRVHMSGWLEGGTGQRLLRYSQSDQVKQGSMLMCGQWQSEVKGERARKCGSGGGALTDWTSWRGGCDSL